MKRIGLIVSVVAAVASGTLAHLYFRRVEAEVSGGPRIPVLVAAEDIAVGAPLTEKVLVVRDIPQAYVEGRQVRASEVQKVLGARVVSGLRANETVLWNDLAKFNEHARVLSGLVQNGMRAVSIDSRSADFQGLLRPGDRVDVLLTTGGKDGPNGSTVTLLQNLLVLSVGGNIARPDDDGAKASGRGSAVSLSTTMEQAQELTQAEQRGRLTLTLRNPDDITIVENVPESTGRDFGTSKDRLVRMGEPTGRKEAIDHVR